MGFQAYTNEGALAVTAAFKVSYATGAKIRLFKSSMSPTPSSHLADFESAECDFSGYAAGGITATFSDPFFAAGGGAATNTQLAQFQFVTPGSGPPVTNAAGGFWIDDGTDALVYGVFDTAIPMEFPGQALPLSAQFVFGA